ncbi:MAG: HD domain-containing protein [Gammaproteobacteria bacterium]|nr:HD domain-containing protein [Gammaproteobacteria bacterium]
MEFHDILHGHIRFEDRMLAQFFGELLDTPEVHRLRNMRQMNFDVPLIQELGRSRRLPHSIGVSYLALNLSKTLQMPIEKRKCILAAALLHDAAIPPFGHLVESELKANTPSFSHEHRLKHLIYGLEGGRNKYSPVVHGKTSGLLDLFRRHKVRPNDVLELVCPMRPGGNAISSGIDIDNIDNVHRMAAMLGWDGAKRNLVSLMSNCTLGEDISLCFDSAAIPFIDKWMEYRQRIYTMIIAHPECIPQNALQADLARRAVEFGIITADDWRMTEPEFEARLRDCPQTSELAWQMISGCDYSLEDYVWFKGYESSKKLSNRLIAERMTELSRSGEDYSIFVWNERGLISRAISISIKDGGILNLGGNSASCMIALVRKRRSKKRLTKEAASGWRRRVAATFSELFGVEEYLVDFPETYTGFFSSSNSSGFMLGRH